MKGTVLEAITQFVSAIHMIQGNTELSANSAMAFTRRSGLLKMSGTVSSTTASNQLAGAVHRDLTFEIYRKKSLVALKILTADSCNGKNDTFESEILRHIRTKSNCAGEASANSDRILGLLDEFRHLGPNGNHKCLVFKPMGPDLSQFRRLFPRLRIPVNTVKRLARDLILALVFLHDKCQTIHTGMLTVLTCRQLMALNSID